MPMSSTNRAVPPTKAKHRSVMPPSLMGSGSASSPPLHQAPQMAPKAASSSQPNVNEYTGASYGGNNSPQQTHIQPQSQPQPQGQTQPQPQPSHQAHQGHLRLPAGASASGSFSSSSNTNDNLPITTNQDDLQDIRLDVPAGETAVPVEQDKKDKKKKKKGFFKRNKD